MGSPRRLVPAALLLLLLVDLGAALVSDEEWAAYKTKYNKHYRFTDGYHRRLYDRKVVAVGINNLKYSAGKVDYFMRLNEYSDTDLGKLQAYRSARPAPVESDTDNPNLPPNYKRYDEIEGGIDWREYGYISAVGNQGICLSCWAFSSSGVLEAHMAKKTGKLVPLSQKQLVDCARYNGCYGGWVSKAFNYTRDNGIASMEDYADYYPEAEKCQYNRSSSQGGALSYVTLKEGDEKQLAEVVYNIGPVAISINHMYDEFEEYGGGVLRIADCTSDRMSLTHSMLVVGFGTAEPWGDYWLIKNSQGTTWGEEGYLRLARNADNMCGVASLAQYPIVYTTSTQNKCPAN